MSLVFATTFFFFFFGGGGGGGGEYFVTRLSRPILSSKFLDPCSQHRFLCRNGENYYSIIIHVNIKYAPYLFFLEPCPGKTCLGVL